MTYNIVEVVPGKYAIRRRTFFEELFNLNGEYLDLITSYCWRSRTSRHFQDCMTSDVDSLRPILILLKSIPKVIA